MRKFIAGVACLSVAAMLATALPTVGGEKGGKIEGNWKAVAAFSRGKKVPQKEIEGAMVLMSFKDGKYTVTVGGKEAEAGTYKTDTSPKPATLDLTANAGPDKGVAQPAIYKVEGDTLTVAMPVHTTKGFGDRPKSFDAKAGGELTTFKRVK